MSDDSRGQLPLAQVQPIADALKSRKESIAVAESSTGGLLNAMLLAVPGASAYMRGGGVIYTLQARHGLMAFSEADMAGIRSSSEPYAALLARRIRERLDATWGLAETGAAGPTGNRYGDAAGHTCLAVSGPVERVLTLETGRSEREENMWAFAAAAFRLLHECIQSAP